MSSTPEQPRTGEEAPVRHVHFDTDEDGSYRVTFDPITGCEREWAAYRIETTWPQADGGFHSSGVFDAPCPGALVIGVECLNSVDTGDVPRFAVRWLVPVDRRGSVSGPASQLPAASPEVFEWLASDDDGGGDPSPSASSPQEDR